MQNYIYDHKFSGNILALGKTKCGKTPFVQKLALNNFFDELRKQNGFLALVLQKKEKLKLKQTFHVKLNFIILIIRTN